MISKLTVPTLLLAVTIMSGCSSLNKTTDSLAYRAPSGTGEVGSSTEQAFSSYKLQITRNNVEDVNALAHSYWSGEYPTPAIDINANKPGTTKITGYTNLRKLTEPVECELKNGVYHPWSNSDESVITYYTITKQSDYKVMKSFTTTDKLQIPAGAYLTNVTYQAENWCGARLKFKKTAKEISLSCDYLANKKIISEINIEKNFQNDEQWVYVKCENKDEAGQNIKAFIQDKYLMQQTQLGIKEACITGYGSVAPSNSKSCL